MIVLHAYWMDGGYAVNTNDLHARVQLNMEKIFINLCHNRICGQHTIRAVHALWQS